MYPPHVTVHNKQIDHVAQNEYLDIHVAAALSCGAHIDYICSEVQ